MNGKAEDKFDLCVLYGSQTGTAQYVAEEVERELIRLGLRTQISSLDDFEIRNLPLIPYVVFVVATTGQGDPPDNMKKFWGFMVNSGLPKDCLQGVSYSVFGLGDSNYQLFNAMARKLHVRLQQLGATPLTDRFLGDDQHPQGYLHEYDPWVEQLRQSLSTRIGADLLTSGGVDPDQIFKYRASTVVQGEQQLEESGGFRCSRLLARELLTEEGYARKTFRIDFENSEPYRCGDILVVRPKASAELVKRLCALLRYDEREVVAIEKNEKHPSVFRSPFPRTVSVFELFRTYLDLNAPASKYFLRRLSAYVRNELHREKLLEMSGRGEESSEEYYNYVRRERRNVYEILFDFNSLDEAERLPLELFLETLPLIQPREYSISSSYLKNKQVVSITLGCVEYQTPFGRKIEGLASQYLRDLPLGDSVTLRLKRGTLEYPEDLETPTVLVGPGTGVAPHIGFLEQRNALFEESLLRGEKHPGGPNRTMLFFGSRYRAKEFYYRELVEGMHELDRLTLVTAFSRDQEAKSYVQHRLAEHRAAIAQLLTLSPNRFKIIVCGTSKFMPQQVEDAFIEIFRELRKTGREEAQEYLKVLIK